MNAAQWGQAVTVSLVVAWLLVYALPYVVDQVRQWWLRRQLAREFATFREQHPDGLPPFRLYVPPAGSSHAGGGDTWAEHGGRWAGPPSTSDYDAVLADARRRACELFGIPMPLPPQTQDAAASPKADDRA